MTRFLVLVLGGLLSGLLIGYCANTEPLQAVTIESATHGESVVIDLSDPPRLRLSPDEETLGRLIVVMSQMIQQSECQKDEPDYIGDPPTRQILPYTFCNCTCPAPGVIHIEFCGRQTSEGCQCP